MQLGICADPATYATLPPLADLDFIEGHVQQFLRPESPDGEFAPLAAALRACGRTMPASNCLFPADLKTTGPAVDQARIERYARTAFRRAREIGMTIVVFGSAGARMIPEGFSAARAFEQYVEALQLLGPIAAENGVTVVVEPLNRGECNLVNTILEGAEAVRRANLPSVQLLLDLFHMLRNGESADDILKLGVPVLHAHVAEDRDRAAPGVHGDDFRPYLRAMRQIGYNARLTIEAVWTDLPRQAGPALAALKAQLADAGY